MSLVNEITLTFDQWSALRGMVIDENFDGATELMAKLDGSKYGEAQCIFEKEKVEVKRPYIIPDPGPVRSIAFEATAEVTSAQMNWPKFNSAHEGFAVLKEEVDELWDHVKTNQKRRDIEAMRKEGVQVAAMAMRFVLEICNEKDGRK